MSKLVNISTFRSLANLPLSPERAQAMTWTEAAQHSLRKWELILELTDGDRADQNLLDHLPAFMGASTCALCQKAVDDEGKPSDCRQCPLELAGHGCEHLNSPWEQARYQRHYRPMIHALRQAVVEARILDCPEISFTELLAKEGAD